MLTDCLEHLKDYPRYVEITLENGEILTMDLCSISEKKVNGAIIYDSIYCCPEDHFFGYILRKESSKYLFLSEDEDIIGYVTVNEISRELYKEKNPRRLLYDDVVLYDIDNNSYITNYIK